MANEFEGGLSLVSGVPSPVSGRRHSQDIGNPASGFRPSLSTAIPLKKMGDTPDSLLIPRGLKLWADPSLDEEERSVFQRRAI